MNRVLSLGIDKRWRKKLINRLPKKQNIECLDLATGTADVAIDLAHDERVKHVVGLDLSAQMLKIGRQKIKTKGLDGKISLIDGDALALKLPDSCKDVTTVAFGVRNFSDHNKSLTEILRILKPGGQVMILEFSIPKNRLIRGPYLLYLRKIMPKIGKIVSKNAGAYSYLNQTIETFPYGENFATDMSKAGFKSIKIKPLTFGIATLYTGVKP